jgi:hypothetical protein
MSRLRPSRLALPAAALALLAACGDSSTAPGGETELISRVTLVMTDGTSTITSFIDDADGNGPGAPSAQSGAIALVAGRAYTGSILFENRLETPAENITEEVEAESDEHRVYYIVTGQGLTVETFDTDESGRPLGLSYGFVPSAAGSGTLRVVLCHYDDAPKVGTSTSCQGETDIDVSFAYTITN